MIYIASDHAGFELKEKIKVFLVDGGYQVEDLGNENYDENDDYPDFVTRVAKKVAESDNANTETRGIILGGSGQGEAMAANRIKGARATVLYNYNENIIKLSREHNNANILSLGARFLSGKDALSAVKLWLETPFSGEERHARRIAKLD